jgi:hypothetical protein
MSDKNNRVVRLPNGRRKVFFMWFRHWRSGKIVRRKNGMPFCVTF